MEHRRQCIRLGRAVDIGGAAADPDLSLRRALYAEQTGDHGDRGLLRVGQREIGRQRYIVAAVLHQLLVAGAAFDGRTEDGEETAGEAAPARPWQVEMPFVGAFEKGLHPGRVVALVHEAEEDVVVSVENRYGMCHGRRIRQGSGGRQQPRRTDDE